MPRLPADSLELLIRRPGVSLTTAGAGVSGGPPAGQPLQPSVADLPVPCWTQLWCWSPGPGAHPCSMTLTRPLPGLTRKGDHPMCSSISCVRRRSSEALFREMAMFSWPRQACLHFSWV